MLTKSCSARVKAAGPDDGLADGVFEAIVSVFGNVDSYGDVVMPGAFTKTLEEWEASGDPIPVLWSHRMDDPDYNIGHVLEAKELFAGDDLLPPELKEYGGLYIKGQLDLEQQKSVQVYRLMKGRRVTQFSFQYDLVDYQPRRDEDGVWELNELKLFEVGPCQIGANQATDLIAVKSIAEERRARAKHGRVFSAKNEEALREALGSAEATAKTIKDLLAVLDSADEEESKAHTGPANDEEPTGAKSEEPSRMSALRLQLLNL